MFCRFLFIICFWVRTIKCLAAYGNGDDDDEDVGVLMKFEPPNPLTCISNPVCFCEDKATAGEHQKFPFLDLQPRAARLSNRQFRIDVMQSLHRLNLSEITSLM
jgi:hypothetical protein